ncbi:MAG: 50S ribosomal protein L10 [Bacteroidaceae bacterium]|nr:50S ribosomal protein L10 [Bacteroidaceae bacterium]
MRKEDKIAIIAQLGELLKQYPHFYLVDVEGMNAASTSSLRRRCFESGLKMVVVKNTLMVKALEAAEQDFDELKPVMVGTTALLLAETANAPAKLIKELNGKKQEKPAFKAAYAEGAIYVGADQLNTLAALKSKNELIADVIAALESPIMNVLSALENREEKAAEAAAE